jgi:uracil-DNA glycosylase family 4
MTAPSRSPEDGQRDTQGLMQRQGEAASSSNSIRVPTIDDEIRERYLDRAIRELNQLGHDLQECEHCPRGPIMPVIGSGHPQADIFLLKHSARPSEIEEGVAFYGRSGNALMKSLKRLQIDPLAVYGTLCVKCPMIDPVMAGATCTALLAREIAIVSPKIMVVMGEPALDTLNAMKLPAAGALTPAPGAVQKLTETIDALYVPCIDDCLDEASAKRAFWSAFRVLGDWWAELPPY